MNARTVFRSVALLALLALCACAGYPKVRIKYHRPPEKPIPDHVKRVAVVSELDPHAYVNEMGITDRIQNKIENSLLRSNFYEIVNRSRLDVLLAEQKLSRSELMEAGQGKEFKLKEVDAFILSKVTKAFYEAKRGRLLAVEKERRFEPRPPRRVQSGKDAQGNPVYREEPQPPREVWVDVLKEFRHGLYFLAGYAVAFKMIDAGSGATYASWDFNFDYDTRTAETFQGQPCAIHPDRLNQAMVSQTLEVPVNRSIDTFLRQVAPYIVEEDVILIPRGPLSKQGIELAQNGLIEEAIQKFDQAAQTEPPPDACWYNKGVMLEALSRYEEALAVYKQAYDANPQRLFLDAMSRMKKELDIAEGAQ